MTSRSMLDFMKTKYKDCATGPVEYDCAAFVRAVAIEVYKANIPDLKEIVDRCGDGKDMERIIEILSGSGFEPVEDEIKEGDIVAISRWNNGFVDHIGIMINKREFAQMRRSGPVIASVNSVPYKRRIRGYYRCKT